MVSGLGVVAAVLLSAGTSSLGPSTGKDVTVSVRASDGTLTLRGSFTVAAPADVAWSVLTDYGGISKFVTSIRRSVVRGRNPNTVWVEQDADVSPRGLGLRVHTLLEVHELASRSLAFHDISRRDFRLYEGTWSVSGLGPGQTRVTYELRANARLSVPTLLERTMAGQAARDLLAEVRTEISRRNQAL